MREMVLTTETGNAGSRNPGIDALLGLAIVLVVFNHLGIRIPLEKTALHDALIEATTGPDMAHIPYPVTQDMVFDAMQRVETL